jgi:NADPH2:quinone reductase
MTAVHAVTLAQAAKDTMLLISGGAGSVSQYLIQFAKRAGAHVITTVSTEVKAKAAREAGADYCIDYRREDVRKQVAEYTANRGVDAVIEMDLAANAKLIPQVLRPKGSVIIYGTGGDATLPSFFCLTQSIRLQFFLVYELDDAERTHALGIIDRTLASGLMNRIAQPTYPLAEIAVAHEAVEHGTIGNVIVTL